MSRNFSLASEDRIKELKQIRLKPNSESKVNWGVNAYNDWRNYRLETFQYDVGIFYADLNDLSTLTKENFCHALCRFIPEVTKQKGTGPYPGRTLYQMVSVIQKFLTVNKLKWKIVDNVEAFEDVKIVLDNVMKERTAANVGVGKKQAGIVMYEMEERLWGEGILGENTPEKLRNTVMFLLGINASLRAIDEHYNLRREMPTKISQLQFVKDPQGIKCLVYREDYVTKTHDGGSMIARMNVRRCGFTRILTLIDVWLGWLTSTYRCARCILRRISIYNVNKNPNLISGIQNK